MNRYGVSSLNELPEVLVEFSALSLARPYVVYQNSSFRPQVSKCELLDRYGYIIPDDRESLLGAAKSFWAEGYGGAGISYNGGGGRCGYDGKFQVKGIGRNCLVGNHLDTAHSDGKLSLQSAVGEVIWSEIFNQVFPIGAVRCVGIILVDIEDCLSSSRALLVRESVVRPAHFERAVYYRPELQEWSDTERVRRAIARLEEFLPMPNAVRCGTGANKAMLGIKELASRYGCQLATSRFKRIFHIPTPSNVAIDGRFLDFGRVTVLRPIGAEVGYWECELKNGHSALLQGLYDLAFYFEKYRDDSSGFYVSARAEIYKSFAQSFEYYSKRQLLEMLGFSPSSASVILSNSCCSGLLGAFDDLILHKKFRSECCSPTYYWPIESAYEGVLAALTCWDEVGDLCEELYKFVSSKQLASRIAAEYAKVLDIFKRSYPHGNRPWKFVRRAMALSVFRQTRSREGIFSDSINSGLQKLPLGFAGDLEVALPDFIDSCVDMAVTILGPCSAADGYCGRFKKSNAFYDLETGEFIVGTHRISSYDLYDRSYSASVDIFFDFYKPLLSSGVFI